MNKGDFISKKEAVIIQGIAVLLMVFHHLFGFPERINVDYIIVSDFSFLHIGTILSYFGRICIAFFAFVSGYGLYKNFDKMEKTKNISTVKNAYLKVFKQLKKFYTRYWLVFFVFVPLGFYLGVYKFELVSFLKAAIGLSDVYNKEWWYVSCYLKFVLAFPILFFIDKLIKKKLRQKAISIIYLAIFTLFTAVSAFFSEAIDMETFSVEICFVAGMACVSTGVFEYLYEHIVKINRLKYVLVMFLALFVMLMRIVLSLQCNYDYLIVPVLVLCIGVLIKSNICIKTINKVLFFVGTYSTYIWLTHTFFAYYYFQDFIYSFKYSTIIFMVCLLCTILTGIIFEFAIKKTTNLCAKTKRVKT